MHAEAFVHSIAYYVNFLRVATYSFAKDFIKYFIYPWGQTFHVARHLRLSPVGLLNNSTTNRIIIAVLTIIKVDSLY